VTTSHHRVGPSIERKLIGLLGDAEAQRLIDEVLPELEIVELKTPEERRRFGEALVRRGGMLAVLGRAIQTQAILHGAGLIGAGRSS
jgi:hypothetical protein